MGQLRLVTALLGAVAATPAAAQDRSPATTETSTAAAIATAQDTATAAPPTGLGEIIVTARRRSESLARVPVSITAFGAVQIAERGIRTEADLQLSTPGLTVRQTSSQNQFNYSIRGQSVDAFSGSAPGVLPYVDDVQVSATTSTSFYDLQSVQILKGPQGTLFGRNATGGAVLYQTQRPTDYLGGYVQGRLGNYDTRGLQGAINLPLVSDKVLLRVAGDYLKTRGYVFNVNDNHWLGGQDQRSGRATLLIKPNDKLSNLTTFQYGYFGGTNAPTQLYSANACGSSNNGIALLSTVSCLYSPAFPGFAAFLATHPRAFPGGIDAFVDYQRRLGPWKADLDFVADHRAKAGFLINNFEYRLGSDLTLKNITGFTRSRAAEQNDFDGTDYPIFAAGTPDAPSAEIFKTRQFSNELQLQGKALGDNLSYIFGVYYSYQRDQNDYPLVAFDLSPVFPGTPFRYHWQITDRSKALFTQATYRVGGGISLTGGLRYTWEKIGIDQLSGSIFAGAPSESQKGSKPSWTASVEYQASPALLLYAATRGSWRTGGFNGTSPPVNALAANGGNRFLAETAKDVELGGKYAGQAGGLPIRINAAAYTQWVKNIQRTAYLIINGNPLAITINVPKAKISGFELDGDVRPTEWLEIGASLAYTKARYTSPRVSYFGTTLDFGPYGDTPRWSGTLFAQISKTLPGTAGGVSLRGDYYAQSTQYFSNLDNTINPNTKLPKYNLVNARVDWTKVMGSGLGLSFYVRNLTNKRYFVGGIPQGADLGLNESSPGRPRMYSFEIKYNF